MMNEEVVARADKINEKLAADEAPFRVAAGTGKSLSFMLKSVVPDKDAVCVPAYHPDPSFWEKKDGEIAGELENFFEDYMQELTPEKIKKYMDPAVIRSRIMPRLYNGRNAGSMEAHGLIHHEVLDLTAGYAVPITDRASLRVSHALLEKAGLPEEEAERAAMQNLYENYDYTPMAEVLGADADAEGPGADILNVLSVTGREYGAACILSDKIMREVAAKTGSRLIILPSSIHEVLVLNESDYCNDFSDLYDMVSSINATVLDPNEKLADNVYLYSPETGLKALFG